MSGGYGVVIDTIERASAAAARAADAVRPVDLAGTLTGIPLGLPGGRSVDAARQLHDVWARELPTWLTNMADYARQLRTAAAHYRVNEADAQADLHEVLVRGGARPV
ncbi:hypothetical protein SAMN05421504_104711 [Amycolatopsis xylanica]|uniref:Excreted virulence factor EspC, type VII ESX diderm n=1 Tax=Amycolatopsis xylanica TaxID=589385 RepID=A0A1H3HMY5_9PSEU|nr:hypothetical protein [Amycolatopsis xylanica]SDY16148.1 hypothetical protein SAMN05421504_104711 [Amycolatopsis xylanica]